MPSQRPVEYKLKTSVIFSEARQMFSVLDLDNGHVHQFDVLGKAIVLTLLEWRTLEDALVNLRSFVSNCSLEVEDEEQYLSVFVEELRQRGLLDVREDDEPLSRDPP